MRARQAGQKDRVCCKIKELKGKTVVGPKSSNTDANLSLLLMSIGVFAVA